MKRVEEIVESLNIVVEQQYKQDSRVVVQQDRRNSLENVRIQGRVGKNGK